MSAASSSPSGRSTATARAVTFIAAVALVALALGSLGRHYWLLDLFSHFRVHSFLALAVCGGVLLVLRRLVAGAVASVAAIAAGASIVSYTGFPSRAAQAGTESFRFATYNRHYGNENYAALGDWLRKVQADVLAMQEADSMQTVERVAALLPEFPHVYAQVDDVYDVAIFSRWPIRESELIELTLGGNEAARVVIDWNGRSLTLIGVHLHWPMQATKARLRNAEFHGLTTLVRDIEGPVLVGGDMNITPWSPVFRDEIARSGLRDCARGHGLVMSWPSWLSLAGIRIDQCLASDHWRVLDVIAGPAFGSDHLAMVNVLEPTR